MLRLLVTGLLPLLPLLASALEIRNYSSSRHDRFVGSGSNLAFNTGAYYNSLRYASVGFDDGGRQYPLVSPEHVLFARHFAPGIGTPIRFLAPGGEMISRSVVAVSGVPNGSGGFADVVIVKLSAAIPPELDLPPFPYLNLAGESAYTGTVLTTFGQALRGGRGTIASFANFSTEGIDETRTFRFNYSTLTGNADDAYAVTGDSGSPTFALVNNRPALVGLHLAASSVTFQRTTIDTFVPHYAAPINSSLAPQGYQLVPAYPDAVALTATASHDELRQAEPGFASITLSNTSANTATNVRLTLVFPADAVPATLSAPGWIVENFSPTEFRLRAATLAANSSSVLTLSYSSLPRVLEIPIAATHRSDGSPELSTTITLPVRPGFAAFVAGLSQKEPSDDPDDDGFSNLLEYAFGGDPRVGSAFAPGGYPLAPQTGRQSDVLTYSFARRTDAAERGLTYLIEFSPDLTEGSWSSTSPAGVSESATIFQPHVDGFEKVTVTVPLSAPRQFVRVRITLDE